MEVAKVYFDGEPPSVYGFCLLKSTAIIISDPKMIEELYVTKNKYFDKSPRVYTMFKPCLGESILFSRSHELW